MIQRGILRRVHDSGWHANYFFASFAHVSLSVIVRFQTCFSRGGIRIERKIAEPLKLIAFFRMRVRKRWLAFRGHDFQRIWINERFEIAAQRRVREQ